MVFLLRNMFDHLLLLFSQPHFSAVSYIYPAIGSQSLEKAGMLSKPSITKLPIHAPLTEITINNPLNSLSTGEE